MNDNDIKLLLRRELENKKVYDASRDLKCDECGEYIPEGDPFYFMGNKEKVCVTCYDGIISWLEE